MDGWIADAFLWLPCFCVLCLTSLRFIHPFSIPTSSCTGGRGGLLEHIPEAQVLTRPFTCSGSQVNLQPVLLLLLLRSFPTLQSNVRVCALTCFTITWCERDDPRETCRLTENKQNQSKMCVFKHVHLWLDLWGLGFIFFQTSGNTVKDLIHYWVWEV